MTYIKSIEILTTAGNLLESWQALFEARGLVQSTYGWPSGPLAEHWDCEVHRILALPGFRMHDRAVALGWLVSRAALDQGDVPSTSLSVVFGSSRGATHRWEEELAKHEAGQPVSPRSSPTTTPSTFSSAISREAGAGGMSLFVSSACSTGVQAVGIGVAVARTYGGNVLVGASEAALTPFTLAQLGRAGILRRQVNTTFLCLSGALERRGMVLAEGAGALILSQEKTPQCLAMVNGFGAATEQSGLTGISSHGDHLARAIEQALSNAGLSAIDVDLIVGHGAGTKLGDLAEIRAYRRIFGHNGPPVFFSKWLTGHPLAASGVISTAFAVQALTDQLVPALPYESEFEECSRKPKRLSNILICAMGFGGSAAALIVSRV